MLNNLSSSFLTDVPHITTPTLRYSIDGGWHFSWFLLLLVFRRVIKISLFISGLSHLLAGPGRQPADNHHRSIFFRLWQRDHLRSGALGMQPPRVRPTLRPGRVLLQQHRDRQDRRRLQLLKREVRPRGLGDLGSCDFNNLDNAH